MKLKTHCHRGTCILSGPKFPAPGKLFLKRWKSPVFLALLLCFRASSMMAAWQDPVDFQSQVKPILSDHCYACHGPDSEHRAADLRLDQLEAVVGEAGVIVPQSLEGSEVWSRIVHHDDQLRMPPPEARKELSASQIEILRQWILQGAKYSGHWAFETPGKPTLPTAADALQNPIDRLVKEQLRHQGIQINPIADRRTLIRRLFLDVIGLPPTTAQIAAFETDPSPDAYQKLVRQLLASPSFGEHMAASWLDQARYADTNGYSIDGGRHMWLWRDWVINAFNQNLPYDQFVLQQMAGDLLPNATIQQQVASGFHRNHSITHEGGTIPEENLVNYVADRIKTTSETFMGLTIACAQCHDHKFDPISQRDYYQLFAYFNSVDDRGLDGDAGRNSVPWVEAPWMLPHTEAEIQTLEARVRELENQLDQPLASQTEWETRQREALARRGEQLQLFPVQILKVTEPNRGDPFQVDDQGTVWVPTPSGRSPSFSVRLPVAELEGKSVTGLRVEFLNDAQLPGQGIGHGTLAQSSGTGDLTGTFLLTSFSISNTEVPADQVDLYRQVPLANVTASSFLPTFPPQDCLDPRDGNGWSPAAIDAPQHITFSFEQAIAADQSPFVTCMLVWGGGHNLVAGKYRFWAVTGNDDGSDLPVEIQALIEKSAPLRSMQESETLAKFYATVANELRQVRADIVTVRQRLRDIQAKHSTMVMNESETPRVTHVLIRGQYDQPGEAVLPTTPASLPKLGDFPANRLGLAQWMVHPENPLTARVAVNRLWKQFFGRGIVHPTADFGAQGNPPTHPELLDFLAVHFVESEWDIKQLITLMLTSETYQRSSHATADQLVQDPDNRWLGRGARFRLSGEVIRDSALAISGQLVDRQGGPPVFPYQPPGLWREVSHFGSTPATAQVFVADQGENLYRRSLYTFWKRTVPPPSMVTFDAPNREICTMDRSATNTPLQALVLLNDVQFVEAARGFATRLLRQSANSTAENDTAENSTADETRLRQAFAIATARVPSVEELGVLQRVLERARKKFMATPADAQNLVNIGDSLVPGDVSAAEVAAWTVVCQMLLNLSETVTRG